MRLITNPMNYNFVVFPPIYINSKIIKSFDFGDLRKWSRTYNSFEVKTIFSGYELTLLILFLAGNNAALKQ